MEVISPKFWTPHLLPETEINKICGWLMAQQRAYTTAMAVMEDMEFTEDPRLTTAMNYVQDLIRHLHAKEKP